MENPSENHRDGILLSRREAVKTLVAGVGASAFSVGMFGELRAEEQSAVSIEKIEREIIFPGRKEGYCRWSPRACVFPTPNGPAALMTTQEIFGSDFFGDPQFTISTDQGKTWSQAEPIPGFGKVPYNQELAVSVCDVVPEYHPQTKQILAIGHNVFYTPKGFTKNQPPRWPVYSTRTAEGKWTGAKKLEWDDPRGNQIYTCNCAQRITLENGEILIPFSFGQTGRNWRSVATLLFSLSGEKLELKQVGNELQNRVKRGFLEPSLVQHAGLYYMTIRAEDDCGYVTTSEDGLHWQEPTSWKWDDGEPITMSSTQQRWLPHSDGLFLVYTRKAEHNQKVMRWRSPLYVARVDLKTLRLIRETEQTVLPLLDDGPKRIAYSGNFHTTIVSPDESWITDGETRPFGDWSGDTTLARIRWNRPNKLAVYSS